MIKVIQQSSSEVQAQIDDDLKNYLRLYYTTELPPKEIRKQLGITDHCKSHNNIKRHMRKEISSQKRRRLIEKGEWLWDVGIVVNLVFLEAPRAYS